MNVYDNENPTLVTSMVCFADILGFKNLVMNSPNRIHGNILLSDLHTTITEQFAELRKNNELGHFKSFTDNMILAYPIVEDGEVESGNIFNSFIHYQFAMTMKGYFLRGGISYGDYYGDADFSYGSALIEAHRLESKVAAFPRIILSSKMIDKVIQHMTYYSTSDDAPQFDILIKDEDNNVFLNYLYALDQSFYSSNDTDDDWSAYIQNIRQHKYIILNNLSKFANDPKIYPKYEWVAQYHNYYCYTFFLKGIATNQDLFIHNLPSRKFSRLVV